MNTAPTNTLNGNITLNGSKSISNRMLIIRALTSSNFKIAKLSNANDTVILERLLKQNEPLIDVGDAGTVCRFMTAYLACQPDRKVLMGSKRMSERPIGALVEALNTLGASIQYVGKEGFTPIKFNLTPGNLQGGKVSMSANISSQFISALLMVAPLLENGIELHLEGKIVSSPYIQMTLRLMEEFGIVSVWQGNNIKVPSQEYEPQNTTVEADWSAASYYYSLVALSENASIQLNGLHQDSVQGDAVLVDIMKPFGVETTFNEEGILLTKVAREIERFEYDFSDCPDLAQTLMVTCAGLNIPAHLTGLETLSIKETDRLAAPQTELEKLGCKVTITADSFQLRKGIDKRKKSATIDTYHDHRMAMSFAPLKLLIPKLKIKNPKVVNKSYPNFWQDFEKLGLKF